MAGSKVFNLSGFLFVGLLMTTTFEVSKVFRDYMRPTDCAKAGDILQDLAMWCLEHVSLEGYILKDNKADCWTMNFTMLRNNTATSGNTTQIHVDIQDLLANKSILFLGDSISRFTMHAFVSFISDENPINWGAANTTVSYNHGKNTTIDWVRAWPASSIIDHLQSKEYTMKYYDHIFLLNGLHEVKDNMSIYEKNIDLFTSLIGLNLNEERAVFQTAPPLNDSSFFKRKPEYSNPNIRKFNRLMVQQLRNKTNIPVVDGYWKFKVQDQIDGVHSQTHGFASAYRYAWYLHWKNEVEQRELMAKVNCQ